MILRQSVRSVLCGVVCESWVVRSIIRDWWYCASYSFHRLYVLFSCILVCVCLYEAITECHVNVIFIDTVDFFLFYFYPFPSPSLHFFLFKRMKKKKARVFISILLPQSVDCEYWMLSVSVSVFACVLCQVCRVRVECGYIMA